MQTAVAAESLALYGVAAQKGSDTAKRVLLEKNARIATDLADAAEILLKLFRYDEAEKYLAAAFGKAPEDSRVRALQAVLRRVRPILAEKEESEATAHWRIGQLLETRGALEEARESYEAALRIRPNHAEAEAGFARVLQVDARTASERYMVLLEPSVRWLAVELAERQLLAPGVRRHRTSGPRHAAEVRNLMGMLLRFGASGVGDSVYDAAIEKFVQATRSDPRWYQPYENLADTYSYRGKRRDSKRNIIDQESAIELYEEALDRIQYESTAHITTIRNRVQIGRSMAEILTRDSARVLAATATIGRIVAPPWKPEQETHARLLYALACWYATSLGIPEEVIGPHGDNRKHALRYLGYSLVRDHHSLRPGLPRSQRKYWGWARTDRDLDTIKDAVKVLQEELTARFKENPQLGKTHGSVEASSLKKTIECIVDSILSAPAPPGTDVGATQRGLLLANVATDAEQTGSEGIGSFT